MNMFDSPYTDAKGVNWPTVGENIRHGAKSDASVDKCNVHITLSGGDWSAEITDNTSDVSDLVANITADSLYLTSPTTELINVTDCHIIEVGSVTGSPFSVVGPGVMAGTQSVSLALNTTGVTACDLTIEVFFKVGEY